VRINFSMTRGTSALMLGMRSCLLTAVVSSQMDQQDQRVKRHGTCKKNCTSQIRTHQSAARASRETKMRAAFRTLSVARRRVFVCLAITPTEPLWRKYRHHFALPKYAERRK
jgi:hypothetical protein